MALLRSLRPLAASLGTCTASPWSAAGLCHLYTSEAAAGKQTQPAASATDEAAPPAQSVQTQTTQRSNVTNEEWTEVIDEKTGQPYYWNQKTGETTDLGEPRPKTRFRDQQWEQAAGSGPFQEGFREPPGRDMTYPYSVLGVIIGVGVGWYTQYLH